MIMKCTRGYQFTKLQEKINHLMYMNDIKLFAKNKKRIGDSDSSNKNIQQRYRNGI